MELETIPDSGSNGSPVASRRRTTFVAGAKITVAVTLTAVWLALVWSLLSTILYLEAHCGPGLPYDELRLRYCGLREISHGFTIVCALVLTPAPFWVAHRGWRALMNTRMRTALDFEEPAHWKQLEA